MTPAYDEITCDRPAPHVLRVTLDRPAALNAYTTKMAEELLDVVRRFERDDDDHVLVLTGAGRAFCSGGDVLEPEVPIKAEARQLGHWVVMQEGIHALAQALYRCDKPLLAAVNGPAVAGGLTLALLCDIRIAGESARLGDTSSRFGYLPDEGGAWLFPRVLGYGVALRMTWLAEVYDAGRSLELGLVDEVVPDADLQDHTLALAARIAARAPMSTRIAKRLMRSGLTGDFERSLEDAQTAVGLVNDSNDVVEGVAAFREKRAPVFRGR